MRARIKLAADQLAKARADEAESNFKPTRFLARPYARESEKRDDDGRRKKRGSMIPREREASYPLLFAERITALNAPDPL